MQLTATRGKMRSSSGSNRYKSTGGWKSKSEPLRIKTREAPKSRNSARPTQKPGARVAAMNWSAGRESLNGLFTYGLSLTFGLAFFILISVGLLAAYRWMTTNPYFAVEEIEVSGNKRLSYEELTAVAGVSLGSNILSVNMKQVESSLLSNPWVEKVSIKRVLPNKFQIHIAEREPCFWVRKDQQIFYADAGGRLITAVEMDRFLSMPLVTMEGVGEDVLPMLQELIDMSGKKRIPFAMNEVAWIRVSFGRGFEFYLDKQERLVSIALVGWKRNAQRLSLAWADLEARGDLNGARGVNAQGNNVWIVRSRADASLAGMAN